LIIAIHNTNKLIEMNFKENSLLVFIVESIFIHALASK